MAHLAAICTRSKPLISRRLSYVQSIARMTMVDGQDLRGYPDRTFRTQILPCKSDSSQVTFQEAGPSRYGPKGSEPLSKAKLIVSDAQSRQSLEVAAAHIRNSQLVSFPSETVYGLGANALSQSASAKIYAAKKRPADNPLIVHVSDLDMLDSLLPSNYQCSQAYHALIQRFWPGPLTLLFPIDTDHPKVPSVVTCGNSTVAIRMPSHPIARALIATSGLPMAGPSANASGRPSPTTAQHVMRDLGGHLDKAACSSNEPEGRLQYILDGGPCDVGLESTVVDGVTAPDELRILRPGGVSVEQITTALAQQGLNKIKLRVYGKDMERSQEQESNPTTPGMKYRHYSPTAKVIMLLSSKLFANAVNGDNSTAAEKVVTSLSGSSTPTHVKQTFADIVQAQLGNNTHDCIVRIGIMCSTDSDLASWIHRESNPANPIPTSRSVHPYLLPPLILPNLPQVQIHTFDLGPSNEPNEYARRMFDGLRTLDEGPLHLEADKCDVIFVEALEDDGVGLAVMNRLKKAASTTVVVDC